LTASS